MNARPPLLTTRRTLRAKRVLDVAVSAAGLVASAPLLAVIATAVRLDSRGPVIFRQERVGRHGSSFRIHKFRTMSDGSSAALVSAEGDARVTRVGSVLRRTKLDELPQLLDVLLGDMALVGPRPEVPRYVAHWPPEARELILAVRPGITDPASLVFRHEGRLLADVDDPETYYLESLLPAKVSLYVDYVRSMSLRGDLEILAATFRAVLRG